MKKFKLTIGDRTYRVEVAREKDPSRLRVKVDDVEHLVTVEEESTPPGGLSPAPTPLPVARPIVAPSPPRVSAEGGGVVTAPLPGVIVSVSVSPGQQIQRGAEVCVLEAMKMETKLLAEMGGEVKEVRVSPGDKVDTGQTLAVIG